MQTDLIKERVNYKFDVEGRLKGGNKDLAPELWNYLFGLYIVDKHDRLIYLYEPIGKKIEKLILTIASDQHFSAVEVFDTVKIIEEETNKVLKTLHDVDLIGILEGIKAVFESLQRVSGEVYFYIF